MDLKLMMRIIVLEILLDLYLEKLNNSNKLKKNHQYNNRKNNRKNKNKYMINNKILNNKNNNNKKDIINIKQIIIQIINVKDVVKNQTLILYFKEINHKIYYVMIVCRKIHNKYYKILYYNHKYNNYSNMI